MGTKRQDFTDDSPSSSRLETPTFRKSCSGCLQLFQSFQQLLYLSSTVLQMLSVISISLTCGWLNFSAASKELRVELVETKCSKVSLANVPQLCVSQSVGPCLFQRMMKIHSNVVQCPRTKQLRSMFCVATKNSFVNATSSLLLRSF